MTKVQKIIQIYLIAVITGFIAGLGHYIYYIAANKYIQYEMYRITIYSFPDILNKWVWLFSLYAVGVITLYIVRPLISRILGSLWERLVSDSACLYINDSGRVIKILLTASYVLLVLYGWWAVNYYWLPGKFHIKSLVFDGVFLVGTLSLGVFLIRINWRALSDKAVRKKYIFKLTGFILAILIISNIYPLFESRTNKTDGPNVIFICIDTLRADHLGSYGYERETSPFIDELAQKGIRFANVTSQSSWTKTSAASFLTSQYGMLSRMENEEDKLPLETNTLAEILKNAGYATGALISNPWLLPQFNFDQGFDHYDAEYVKDEMARRINVNHITEYLDNIRENKFFLYLHFMDVHNPYAPPAPYNRMFAGEKGRYQYHNGLMKINSEDLNKSMGLYDGEIRFLDDKIRDLFSYLDKHELLKNTIVIINSDHGEEFMEHGGMGHGATLYREQLHVPLFILPPGGIDMERSIIPSPVRNIDILPTILDMLNIEPAADIDGVSLLDLIKGGDDLLTRPGLSRVVSHGLKDRLTSLSKGEYHYIYNISKDLKELYDLQSDPEEKNNLVGTKAELAETMHDEMEKLTQEYLGSNTSSASKTSINKQTLDTLKSLGYVQ